jgi:Fungal specific transcription factor domain
LIKYDRDDETRTEAASLGQSGDYSDSASNNEDMPGQVVDSVNLPNESINAETAPLFIGDQQGIGMLLEITHPPTSNQKQQHFMIPRLASKVLAREDLEYLKAKGCFSLPSTEICTALVDAYFKFVHFLFPIIDAQEFLGRYESHGVQQINLLLLWSMFSVSASYISETLLKKAEYYSRKQFKEDIIKRAKLLFDLSCENDKIILIQSSLLLGFWFQDAADVKQSWYWTGIATSIAQTIGLHRNPDGKGKRKNKAISERQRRLWRNIWWSCFMRDTWLAFGMGRPVRTSKEDCDCPMPTIEDSEESFRNMIPNVKEISTEDSVEFANLWLELLRLSEGLHKILKVRYRGNASPSQIEALKNELGPRFERCLASTSTPKTANIPITVATRHLQLHILAAQIALFRSDTDPSSVTKIQDVANSVNGVIEKSVVDGTAVFWAPRIVPLITPAMFSHLMMVREGGMKGKLGRHKFDFGLMFLKTLEDNYPSAAIVHRLFTTALAVGQKRSNNEEGVSAAVGSKAESTNAFSPGDMGSMTIDAHSEGSSIGYSPSGFALLPMQDPWFDMRLNETDQ